MQVEQFNYEDYRNLINNPYIIYNSADFNRLNKSNCDDILFLVFKNTKYRLGLCGGIKGSIFFSPFSAPFGGFSFIENTISVETLDEAVYCLDEFLIKIGIQKTKIILPPDIYNRGFISKQISSFFRQDYLIENIDLNFHFETDQFNSDYLNSIKRSARKNYLASLKQNLNFVYCESLEQKIKAYDIIKINREAKGYPLRMNLDQILKTIQLVPADFFIVELNNLPIASAVIFHVSKDIVQIIYWGDNPYYSFLKPMNFISFNIFKFYNEKAIYIVDIGPSTENSIPNYGLCDFKESIGSIETLKISLSKEYKND